MKTTAADKAAALLIAARRTREPLERLPEDCRPQNITDAFAIQAATVEQLGERNRIKVRHMQSMQKLALLLFYLLAELNKLTIPVFCLGYLGDFRTLKL